MAKWKPTATQLTRFRQIQPLMQQSLVYADNVMARTQLIRLYGADAIEQAIIDKIVMVVKIRYTDPTNQQPPSMIECICLPSWDRTMKPRWLL